MLLGEVTVEQLDLLLNDACVFDPCDNCPAKD